jgi:predicted transposase YdaD
MTATFVLTGLRIGRQNLAGLFQGVKIMHESSAFALYEEKGREEGRMEGRQEGRVEGRVEESHRLLLRQGSKRFGVPDAATEATLLAIHDLDRLERLADAMFNAQSWHEFLATP